MVGGIPAPHSEWGCKPKPQKIPPPLGGSDGLLLRTVRCSISRRTAPHEVVPPWWRIGGLVTCGRNARSRLLPGRYNGRLPGAPDLSAFRWVAPRGSVRGSLCWPLGSSGRSLRALSLPTPCSEAAEYRELSAHRLHKAWEPAPLGWFPMPHRNPTEWILMHRP